jgi:hypothetical protein
LYIPSIKQQRKHVAGITLQSFVIILYFTIPYLTIYLAQSIMPDVCYAKLPMSVLRCRVTWVNINGFPRCVTRICGRMKVKTINLSFGHACAVLRKWAGDRC